MGENHKLVSESTIIDIRTKPKILRLGGLEILDIQKVLNKKNR